MGGIFPVTILLTILTSIVLGLGVFMTNPKRLVNKQFLALTVLITLWMSCQWNALFSIHEAPAIFWIKQANMVSALIPCFFNLLRISIIYPNDTWFKMLGRAKNWFFCYIPIAVVCQLPIFLNSLQETESHIHVPQFGPGMGIYAAYFLISLWVMVFRYVRNLKVTRGIERTELQFTLLGCGAALGIGAIFGILIPNLTNFTAAVQFTPLSIIALDGFIAYGIATGRIMGIENILRTIAAYSLLIAYLTILYIGVDLGCHLLLDSFISDSIPIPELISALVVAFTLAPMNSRLQNVANRLFVNWQTTDVQKSASMASSILQSISTLDDLMERFSNLVSQTLGTDDVRIYRQVEGTYTQVYPRSENLLQLPSTHPMVNLFQNKTEAVATELMKRRSDQQERSYFLPALQSLKAAAAVGIRSKNRLDGIIFVGPRLSGRIYGKLELQALQLLASQLAVALDNAQLYTELQNSKIYNDILLDNMVSGVIAVTQNGRITVFNREAQRITGLNPNEVIGHPMETLPEVFRTPIQTTLDKRYSLRDIEASVSNVEGEDIPLRVGTSLFYSHDGAPLGAMAVLNDMSKIRQLENQIRRTDRLASLGTLSAGMAHEIKNPLVTIKTFTSLLPERYDDSDFRHTFSDLVGHEVGRIDSIVNQLLTFARPSKPNFSTLSIDDVINHCSRLIEQQLRSKGVQLRMNLATANSPIQGDPDLLEQVFINFFLNAIDAMDSGGMLSLESKIIEDVLLSPQKWSKHKPTQAVKVTIRDTGSGINKDDLSQVFDPFFTTKSNGTGMGLAVTFSILQDHGATVDVHSEVGHGTSFTISFPTISQEVRAS